MNPNKLLSDGLQKGFGGSTNMSKDERGSFRITVSHYEQDGNTYHDEWVNGGGQELARDAQGNAITRTYVGNVVSEEKLTELGITEKDIMNVLKRVIVEHGSEIRLETDFEINFEEWEYTYRVTYRREDPYIINGIEEIYYKGESVFVHTFGISKVVES